MSNLHLVAARGAGRSFPVFPRTVSIYSNNYRKMHGMPMKRRVHLRKYEKQRRDKILEEYLYNMFFPVVELSTYDLPASLSEIGLRHYLYYGQKVINQNAVVKIVTSGEENGDAQIHG